MADINQLCARDVQHRFADDKVSLSQVQQDFLSPAGDEW
jgi:hypothetical protein